MLKHNSRTEIEDRKDAGGELTYCEPVSLDSDVWNTKIYTSNEYRIRFISLHWAKLSDRNEFEIFFFRSYQTKVFVIIVSKLLSGCLATSTWRLMLATIASRRVTSTQHWRRCSEEEEEENKWYLCCGNRIDIVVRGAGWYGRTGFIQLESLQQRHKYIRTIKNYTVVTIKKKKTKKVKNFNLYRQSIKFWCFCRFNDVSCQRTLGQNNNHHSVWILTFVTRMTSKTA